MMKKPERIKNKGESRKRFRCGERYKREVIRNSVDKVVGKWQYLIEKNLLIKILGLDLFNPVK